jgi:GAF domain-containing protein
LLKTFADQAVIAIENVRLFKELQQRTDALGKSVEQLTALGEVGQAISSTLDLETVLKTIATRAVQLTGLDGASIYEYDEQREEFRLQAADKLDEAVLSGSPQGADPQGRRDGRHDRGDARADPGSGHHGPRLSKHRARNSSSRPATAPC